MTISSETNRSGPYQGNGVTTIFDYDFKIDDRDHLRVIILENGVETDAIIDAVYTVTGVGEQAGGSSVFLVPPTADQSITLLRKVPFTQETDLENQGAYNAETVERALDLAAARDQQLQEQLDRSIKISASADPGDLDSLISDVLAIASIAAQVEIVANNIASVNAVATVDTEIVGVYAVRVEVVQLAAVSGQIATLAPLDDELIALAPVATQIGVLAGIDAELLALYAIRTDISAVAAIDEDVSTAAANITAIQDAPAAAALAAKWASEAEDVPVLTGPNRFSAFHWAQKALTAAASIFLPAVPVALNYLRRNATNTAYESRTPAQVIADLGLAWVSFNGVNGTIFGASGVSSVVRNSTGNYTVNFATAKANTNYAVQVTGQKQTASTTFDHLAASKTTSSCLVRCADTAGSVQDATEISVAIFS